MSKNSRRLLSILAILLISAFLFIPAQAQEDDDLPIVRAVFFHSPTCPHCEDVIQNHMPLLLDQYGQQLNIVAINVTLPKGQELYQSMVDYYELPVERLGVPALVINEVVLVGGAEIPAQFPGIVAEQLASGGNDWPAIPGLAEVVSNVQFDGKRNEQTGAGINDGSAGMLAKFKTDPVANTIAVIVLIGMVASIVGVGVSFSRPLPEKDFWPPWVIPLLSVLGIGVAIYLTYIETSGAEAVCGPVGDCNAVQLSPYATLFGFLPVGVLGIIGYALILITWGIYTYGPENLRWTSAIAIWGMSFFGVLFSIYLTFLEPFVIGATCMWCISSAIFQTVIFLAATGPAKRAWQEDDFDDDEDFEAEDQALPDAEIGESDATSAETEAIHHKDEEDDLVETDAGEMQAESVKPEASDPEEEVSAEPDQTEATDIENEPEQENGQTT